MVSGRYRTGTSSTCLWFSANSQCSLRHCKIFGEHPDTFCLWKKYLDLARSRVHRAGNVCFILLCIVFALQFGLASTVCSCIHSQTCHRPCLLSHPGSTSSCGSLSWVSIFLPGVFRFLSHFLSQLIFNSNFSLFILLPFFLFSLSFPLMAPSFSRFAGYSWFSVRIRGGLPFQAQIWTLDTCIHSLSKSWTSHYEKLGKSIDRSETRRVWRWTNGEIMMMIIDDDEEEEDESEH